MKIWQAEVVFPPKDPPLSTQYGDRYSCALTLSDGREIKIWASPGPLADRLKALQRGATVAVVETKTKQGKPKFDISEDDLPDPAPQNRAAPQSAAPVQHQPDGKTKTADLAAAVDQEVNLLLAIVRKVHDRCYKVFTDAEGNPPDFIEFEDIRAMASSIYIETNRRHRR